MHDREFGGSRRRGAARRAAAERVQVAARAAIEPLERRVFLNAADLDPTFGTNGVAYADVMPTGIADSANAAVVQPDGKVLVAGTSSTWLATLTRYNPDGSLDTSFDGDGKEPLPTGAGTNLALLPGGKILVEGISLGNGDLGYTLIRLNADGSPDPSFGSNGGVYWDAPSQPSFTPTGGLAVQPDGKILIGGRVRLGASHYAMAVARFNADGSLDTTFGTNGRASIDFNSAGTEYSMALAVGVQADGRIVVSGDTVDPYNARHLELDLARFNANGSLDAGFGSGGTVATAGLSGGTGLVIAADGTIAVSGHDASHFEAVRYTASGQLDASFGAGGVASYRVPGYPNGPVSATSIGAAPDGKLVLVGNVFDDMGVMRLTAAGQLDQTFGTGGITRVTFPAAAGAGANAVAFQPDGRAIVVGSTMTYDSITGSGTPVDLAVARLTPSGAADPTFGNGTGEVTTDAYISGEDYATSMALQADGRIVIQGTFGQNSAGQADGGLARLLPNGQPDRSFNGTGNQYVFTSSWGDPVDVAQRDGKVVVFSKGYYDIEAIRFDNDGSLDAGTFGDSQGMAGASGGSMPRAGAGLILPDQRVLEIGDDGTQLVLARFNPDGTRDATFGTNGVRLAAAAAPHVADAALLPDGRFVVAYTSNLNGGDAHIALARFNADGSFDTTFGANGTVTIDPSATGKDVVNHIALDAAGDVIAAGSTAGAGSNVSRFVAARFTPDGVLDPTFGGGTGWATVDFGRLNQVAYGVDVQADGKIVLAGSVADDYFNPSTAVDMAAARLTASGALDTTFNGSGTWTMGQPGKAEALTAGVAIQPDGKILLGGYAPNGNHGIDFVTVRMMGDPVAAQPFTIEAYGPYHVQAGGAVTVSAFAAPATGRTVVKYEWDLNYDGSTFNPTATGAAVSFSAAGLARGQRRNIALRVTDDLGNTRLDTTWVDVTNGVPTIAPANLSVTPGAIDEGQTVTLTGSFTDGDVADAHTVTVDWGDAKKTTITLAAGVTTFSASHVISDDRPTETPQDVTPIKVTVSDGIDSTTASTSVLVRNVAPTVTLGADRTVNEGATVTLSPTVVDPGFDGFAYRWHVTASNGQVIADGTSSTWSFKAADDGTYTVSLTVTDDDGGVGTSTLTVTSLNVPPAITLTGKATAVLGTAYPLTVAVTDPGQDIISSWSVDWGDGSTVESYIGPTPPTLSHTFAALGDYVIKVSATDEDGTWTVTKSVSAIPAPYVDANGVLRVVGGIGDDTMSAYLSGGTYYAYINSTPYTFAASSVTSLAIEARGGNDAVTLNTIGVTATVDLGDGDDQFKYIGTGALAGLVVTGGNGNDTCAITAGSGTVSFDGQAGSDTLLVQNGTTGADTYNITTGKVTGASLTATWANAESLGVYSYSGNDVINVNFAVPDASDPKNLTIDAGEYDNTINITRVSPGTAVSLVGGSGNDTFNVAAGAQAAIALNAGYGVDTLVFNGSDVDDAFTIGSSSAGDGSSTVTYAAGSSQAPDKVTVNANGGDDTVTVDCSSGKSPVLSGPLTINGGTGVNALTFVGSGGTDALTVGGSSISVSGNGGGFSLTLNVTSVQSLRFPGGSGGNDSINVTGGNWALDADAPGGPPNVAVSVQAGAVVSFASDQHLAGLTVTGGFAMLSASSPTTLTLTGPLLISGGGTLDLGAGALLVPSAPAVAAYLTQAAGPMQPNGLNAWTGGSLTSRLVQAGAAAGNAKQLALGFFDSQDNAQTGLNVPAGQTLVKVTVYGDATGDGKVTIADLSVWNNNFGVGAPRWSQGDFNYDGTVNIADLSIWNNDFGNNVANGGAAAAAAMPVAAVPPSTTSSPSPAATVQDLSATPTAAGAPLVTPAQSIPLAGAVASAPVALLSTAPTPTSGSTQRVDTEGVRTHAPPSSANHRADPPRHASAAGQRTAASARVSVPVRSASLVTKPRIFSLKPITRSAAASMLSPAAEGRPLDWQDPNTPTGDPAWLRRSGHRGSRI